jgi:hypothetical protein
VQPSNKSLEKNIYDRDSHEQVLVYSACGSLSDQKILDSICTRITENNVLKVKAIFIDMLSGPAADAEITWAPVDPEGEYWPTGKKFKDVSLRTTVADIKMDGSSISRGSAMDWGSDARDIGEDFLQHSARYKFNFALQAASTGRRETKSTQGFYTLVPENSRDGDIFCALLGGKVLYVLRPLEDNEEEHYEFVGERYVHGLMDGKVMDLQREGKVVVQDIGIV